MSSAHQIAFSCQCGQLKGTLTLKKPGQGLRLSCYCPDCQAFMHYLDQETEILDSHAGTEIFQTSPAGFHIEQGEDQLAAVQLTDKGVTRWYARCCKFPIANTANSAKLPFAGFITHGFESNRREEIFGPSEGSVYMKLARPELEAGKAASLFKVMSTFFARMLKDRFSGRWRISPFFDTASDTPKGRITKLSDAERDTLYSRLPS